MKSKSGTAKVKEVKKAAAKEEKKAEVKEEKKGDAEKKDWHSSQANHDVKKTTHFFI